MNEEQKNQLIEMLKSHGWKLFEELNKQAVEEYRRLATQPKINLEDRLWYSAVATGREEAIQEVVDKLKK